MALADRFKTKINPKAYYLSYSGGRDSHFLYWFIKNWLKDTDIVVVGVNTGMDIPEIRDRILNNSDVVLHPMMHRDDIKAEYGIPCFSKQHDEYIYRYQHGSRSENTMKYINGENPENCFCRTAFTRSAINAVHTAKISRWKNGGRKTERKRSWAFEELRAGLVKHSIRHA